MDTSFLTIEAYDLLIGKSADISDDLTSEIGMIASESSDEDGYIKNVLEYLDEIFKDPEEFLESWDLIETTDIKKFKIKIKQLIVDLIELLKIPYNKRTQEDE